MHRFLAVAAAVCVASCASRTSSQRVADAPAARPPAERARTDRTDVVPQVKAPLLPGRNAVWCATSQLAWDALVDVLGPVAGTPGALHLGPPAPRDAVEELNRRLVPLSTLAPSSFVALGGFVKDGIVERIRAAVAATFGPDAPLPTFTAGPDDAVGYARLRRDLPFRAPFRVLDPIAFAGGARVRAFGIEMYDSAGDALRTQVVVHRPAGEDLVHSGAHPWRGVVELAPSDTSERIVLSSLEPGDTLDATWRKAADRLEKGRAEPLEGEAELAIPRIRLDLHVRFAEFIGAPIEGIPLSFVREFRQSVAFSLTERGAAVTSEAVIEAYCAPPEHIRFEGPFLLALLRRGETRPYLLVWIGNDDLLEREAPGPASGPGR